MARDSRPPVRRDPLAVAGVDERDVTREIERQLKRRRKRRGPQRSKATFDLPAGMIERIRNIAKSEKVPASDVAALALAEWLSRYEPGQLEDRKEPTDAPRFTHKLTLPGDW